MRMKAYLCRDISKFGIDMLRRVLWQTSTFGYNLVTLSYGGVVTSDKNQYLASVYNVNYKLLISERQLDNSTTTPLTFSLF